MSIVCEYEHHGNENMEVPVNGYENMGVQVNGNGTDLGVNVFQTLHHLPEQPPDVVWTGDQLPRVYQLPQSLVLTVLHLSHDSHMTP